MRLLLIYILVSIGTAYAVPTSMSRRVAVIIGANQAAPGQEPLRHAHRDAMGMADVLIELGNFTPEDVSVLLDPEPDAVILALRSQLAKLHPSAEGMLLLYYSGHADDRALYPAGRPLPLGVLKDELDRARTLASIRVGIVDACRGGAWTRAKGLRPDAPFEVALPSALAAEGSVLLASSSGLEDSHETDSLQASYFTHHLIAGLRGAADRSGDGEVTLSEAFEYARAMTVRDTALRASEAQHPSFEVNLRGRRDLGITRIAQAKSVIDLKQESGPVQVIDLRSGLTILEMPEGKRKAQLALLPGRYVVRVKDETGFRAREVELQAGSSVQIAEQSLELAGTYEVATKRPQEPLPVLATTTPGGHVRIELGGAMSLIDTSQSNVTPEGSDRFLKVGIAWGVTDRLELSLFLPSGWIPLGMAYRLGSRGKTELVPWFAFGGFGLVRADRFLAVGESSYPEKLGKDVDAGLDVRQWFSSSLSLIAGVQVEGLLDHSDDSVPKRVKTPTASRAMISVAVSKTIAQLVTVNLGAFASRTFIPESDGRPEIASAGSQEIYYATKQNSFGIGSVKRLGPRVLPLVQLHLNPSLSIDADAAAQFDYSQPTVTTELSLGLTAVF